MANEPSLGELSITPQPVAAAPIIDNSHVVDQLNQNARFHAENVWNQYTQFLQNKKDLFKNIGDVQELDTLPEDSEVLRKQAGDIMAKIMKDPSIVTGGKGFNEVQSDIAKFRSDAMASKQFNLDYKANKLALDRMPELNSEENLYKLEAEKAKPPRARKSVMFDLPAILDTKKNFEDLLSNKDLAIVQPYVDNTKTNAAGEPIIETGLQLDTKALEAAWGMAAKGGQRDKNNQAVTKAIKYNFSKLPTEQQQQYAAEAEKAGIAPEEVYWNTLGKQMREAYFAGGVPDKNGIIRYAKTNSRDPYFIEQQRLELEKQRLAQKTADDAANLKLRMSEFGLKEKQFEKADKEDLSGALTVVNQITDDINNAQPRILYGTSDKKEQKVKRTDNPLVLQKFSTLDKNGNVVNMPAALDYDEVKNQFLLQFDDPDRPPTDEEKAKGIHHFSRTIPMDQRVVLKIITASSFPNKDIGGINTMIEKLLDANKGSIGELARKRKASKDNTTPPPASKNVTSKGLPIIGQ